MLTDRIIGLDLDGVIRHNNKSLGAGDVPKEKRNRVALMMLHKERMLPRRYYVTEPGQVQFIDGALKALRLFKSLEIPQYVFSNQEAIGLGIMSNKDMLLLVDYMNIQIGLAGGKIDGWYWCPHFPDEGCDCRKPKPGLFHNFRDRYEFDLSNMVYVGDNPSDMAAAHEAGCGLKVHIILDTAEEEFRHSEYADITASSLEDAVPGLLRWIFGLDD